MTTPEQLRDIVVSELKLYRTLADQQVFTFFDWPTTIETMPAVLVYDTHDEKISMARAQPNFTTTTVIHVDARCATKKLGEAQTVISTLRYQIEQAVLCSQKLQKFLQQISKVSTTKTIASESDHHTGRLDMDFYLEFFQSQEDYYVPVDPYSLEQIAINVDLINVYDASHTYVNPPFPNSVVPAPRTAGPDGRNEGYLQIDVPTS